MIVIWGWKLMWCASSCCAPRMQKVSKPPDYIQTHHPWRWLLAAKLQVGCVCQIFHPTSKPVITDRFQRCAEENNRVCLGATRGAELSPNVPAGETSTPIVNGIWFTVFTSPANLFAGNGQVSGAAQRGNVGAGLPDTPNTVFTVECHTIAQPLKLSASHLQLFWVYLPRCGAEISVLPTVIAKLPRGRKLSKAGKK